MSSMLLIVTLAWRTVAQLAHFELEIIGLLQP